MRITVNIYAYLRYYLPSRQKSGLVKEWEMPEGATVRDVLLELQLPKEVRVTVLVNNNSVDQKTVLKDGDVLHILPQMVGGCAN
jgi:molybdopterin converting factor small subunit